MISMYKQIAVNLWAAHETLEKGQSLNEEETAAVKQLLTEVLGTVVPAKQERELYEEALILVDQAATKESAAFFRARINQYEKKYQN